MMQPPLILVLLIHSGLAFLASLLFSSISQAHSLLRAFALSVLPAQSAPSSDVCMAYFVTSFHFRSPFLEFIMFLSCFIFSIATIIQHATCFVYLVHISSWWDISFHEVVRDFCLFYSLIPRTSTQHIQKAFSKYLLNVEGCPISLQNCSLSEMYSVLPKEMKFMRASSASACEIRTIL